MTSVMPTNNDIDDLVKFLPKLYAEGFEPIEGWPAALMCGPIYMKTVHAFIRTASQDCWDDYGYKPEVASKLIHDSAYISTATLAEIKTLLTFCIRQERFCSGHVAGMIKENVIRQILERLWVIRENGSSPRLTTLQREQLFEPLFQNIQRELKTLSGGDERLLWALRKKLAKELVYLERGKPAERAKLKILMWNKQKGICALCNKSLVQKGSELDRFNAFHGYIESNVRLVHHDCHAEDQAKKGFS